MVTPPEVPIPGIAGGGKENASPSDTPASCRCTLLWMASICSAFDLRCSQGFSDTKKNAVLVLCVWVSRLKPSTATTPSIPGVFRERAADPLRGLIGPLQGGRIRQLQGDEQIPLIFLRDEAGRQRVRP